MAAETKIVIIRRGPHSNKLRLLKRKTHLNPLNAKPENLQGATRATAAALELGGNQAKEAAGEFDVLGRQIFKSSPQKRSVLAVSGVIPMAFSVEANGANCKKPASRVDRFSKSFETSGRSIKFFTNSVESARFCNWWTRDCSGRCSGCQDRWCRSSPRQGNWNC